MVLNIKMVDFQRGSFRATRNLLRSARLVLRSGNYILGDEVRAFEREFSKELALPFAVGVGNGMDALELGLKAIGVRPGEEVITSHLTAFATVLSIVKLGAVPEFADIDPDTGLIDVESARSLISSKVKAIVVVHLYGRIANMPQFVELCQETGIELVEDCAQSAGAELEGISAGGFGAFGAYSFYPTKNLGAIGDGGAVVSKSERLVDTIQKLRNYGQSSRYVHELLGSNSRLDELQASFLRVKLRELRRNNANRRTIAKRYFGEIDSPHVQLLSAPQSEKAHVYHLFVLLTDEREALSGFLRDRGIESLIHYPVPAHKQPALQSVSFRAGRLSCVERFSDQCLSIPTHPGLSKKQVTRVISAINDFKA